MGSGTMNNPGSGSGNTQVEGVFGGKVGNRVVLQRRGIPEGNLGSADEFITRGRRRGGFGVKSDRTELEG